MERMRPAAIWTVLAVLAAALVLGGCVKPLDLLGVVEQRVEEATNPQPGILVSSGGTDIPSGGSQSMGSAVANSTYNDVAFLIENPGNAALSLSGIPSIALTGANADEFSVPASPSASIAAGGSSAFTIRFQPTSSGAKTATVTIANNTEDAPTFSFGLTATATPTPVPAMAVSQTGAITYNSTFNFPATIRTYTTDRIFTITNNGTAPLTVGSVTVPAGYSLAAAPEPSVAAGGGTTTFTIRFAPAAVATYSGTVTISSNDPTYPSFVFTASGQGTEWHGLATVASANDVGRYTSIGVSGAYAYIAYQDTTNGDLKVSRSTNSALTWPNTYTPDATGAGQNTSLVIVGSDVYVAYCEAPVMLLIPSVVKGTGGTSWGGPVQVDTNGGIDISLTHDGSTFYLAYATPSAVHVNQSANGTTWSSLDFDMYSAAGIGQVAAASNNGRFWVARPLSSPTYLAIDSGYYWNLPNVWMYGTADNPTNAVGEYVSAAAYGSDYVYLAYYDASNSALKFNNVSRGGSDPTYLTIGTPKTLDSIGTVGKYTSIACSADGVTIYISYYDETNGDLKLAKSTNSGSTFVISTVDSTGNVGQYASIAVDGSNVYISYYDVTNGDLKIAKSLDGGANW